MKPLRIYILLILSIWLISCQKPAVLPVQEQEYLWGDTGCCLNGKTFRDKGRQWKLAPYYTLDRQWLVTSARDTVFYYYDTGGGGMQGSSLGNYYDELYANDSTITCHERH